MFSQPLVNEAYFLGIFINLYVCSLIIYTVRLQKHVFCVRVTLCVAQHTFCWNSNCSDSSQSSTSLVYRVPYQSASSAHLSDTVPRAHILWRSISFLPLSVHPVSAAMTNMKTSPSPVPTFRQILSQKAFRWTLLAYFIFLGYIVIELKDILRYRPG